MAGLVPAILIFKIDTEDVDARGAAQRAAPELAAAVKALACDDRVN
jgi:hypothetical protein